MKRTSILTSMRGQSLVEFVLVTPLLLLFLAAVIDIGALVNRYNKIDNILREGAKIFSETRENQTTPTACPAAGNNAKDPIECRAITRMRNLASSVGFDMADLAIDANIYQAPLTGANLGGNFQADLLRVSMVQQQRYLLQPIIDFLNIPLPTELSVQAVSFGRTVEL